MANIICGVDVSGQWLDARVGRGGPKLRAERTPEGIAELAAFCAQHGVELAAMEATGGYERLPFALLWEAGVPCAVLNPRQVRRFAEAMGAMEKTDDVDAGMIAECARARGAVPRPPPPAAQARLEALETRLSQLVAIKVAQQNQARLVEDRTVKASFAAVLKTVLREIGKIEAQIASLLAEDPHWRAIAAALREVKGVAGRTVARVMAQMPEIGTLTGKAAAKLAGLAPLANDSGRRHGARSCRGGRAEVRSILYVIVTCVARHNPDFAAMRQRLLDKGKAPKAVRIALARKLLVQLNAKARDARAALQA